MCMLCCTSASGLVQCDERRFPIKSCSLLHLLLFFWQNEVTGKLSCLKKQLARRAMSANAVMQSLPPEPANSYALQYAQGRLHRHEAGTGMASCPVYRYSTIDRACMSGLPIEVSFSPLCTWPLIVGSMSRVGRSSRRYRRS